MMKRGQRSCDALGVGRTTGYAIANRMRGKSDSLTFDESDSKDLTTCEVGNDSRDDRINPEETDSLR
jgi:hypothetical protein